MTAPAPPRPRVAMVGQPEYFRCLYEKDLDPDFEIFEFDLQWGRDWTAYKPVIRFDPDVAFFFRPEMYPEEFLDLVKCRKIALSSEPIPKYVDGELVTSEDMVYRFESLSAARDRYDRFYHYDRTSIPFLEENGFADVGEFVFPVATGTYRPIPVEKSWDACFFGRDTPYRELHLGTLKRDFDVLHVAHGVVGEDWVRFVNRSRIGINLHIDEKPSLEHRMQNMMACGVMVMSDRLTHNEILRAGEHYVEFDGPDDFRQKVEHYLAHDDERKAIARRGRERVLECLDGARTFGGLISEIILTGR